LFQFSEFQSSKRKTFQNGLHISLDLLTDGNIRAVIRITAIPSIREAEFKTRGATHGDDGHHGEIQDGTAGVRHRGVHHGTIIRGEIHGAENKND
jgi:hypothetical protein